MLGEDEVRLCPKTYLVLRRPNPLNFTSNCTSCCTNEELQTAVLTCKQADWTHNREIIFKGHPVKEKQQFGDENYAPGSSGKPVVPLLE